MEISNVIGHAAITVCALLALMTPLLLWTAWSRTMFWLIVVVGCAAILVIFLLIRWWPHERF
jgi:predicted membrane channel-forming protein YqfA (hemolysin III family)